MLRSLSSWATRVVPSRTCEASRLRGARTRLQPAHTQTGPQRGREERESTRRAPHGTGAHPAAQWP